MKKRRRNHFGRLPTCSHVFGLFFGPQGSWTFKRQLLGNAHCKPAYTSGGEHDFHAKIKNHSTGRPRGVLRYYQLNTLSTCQTLYEGTVSCSCVYLGENLSSWTPKKFTSFRPEPECKAFVCSHAFTLAQHVSPVLYQSGHRTSQQLPWATSHPQRTLKSLSPSAISVMCDCQNA